MIQSQTVMLPFAAIDGTTFRLKTATTKSNTRSKRPSTRFRWGWLASLVSTAKVPVLVLTLSLLSLSSFRAKGTPAEQHSSLCSNDNLNS